MEMEHINDNTIRVLIKSEDLAARGITFLDLLGNHNEIDFRRSRYRRRVQRQ